MTITTLLLIDVQRDFHPPHGTLAIPSAMEDAERIAALIRVHGTHIDRIIATIDTHNKLHISHPSFWCKGVDNSDSGGDSDENTTKGHPEPFTIISYGDVKNGLWKPRPDLVLPNDANLSAVESHIFADLESVQDKDTGKLDLGKYVVEYTRRLEEKGRFQHCIWPEHCVLGTNGHAMVDCVREALDEWSEVTGRSVEWILKGRHLLTEMYSSLEAEVPVSASTSFNTNLQSSLLESNRLIVCGQAMSHCVNYTLRDIVSRWPEEHRSRIILLTDCASAVPGFEDAANRFQSDMQAAGVRLAQATQAFQD